MTVETHFDNWQLHQPEDDVRYNRCSPNLQALERELKRRWQMTSNGCYAERDIRAGTKPSSHSHGAAIDMNYPERPVALAEILPWLIDYSHELHVQAIHDYYGSRIWRAGRTDGSDGWRVQAPSPATGMGQSWARYFHIETNEAGWVDGIPIDQRSVPTVPVTPTPIPPGAQQIVFTRTIRPGDQGPDVAFVQTVIRAPGSASGNKQIVVDGRYGAQTVQAVKNIQGFTKLAQDGIIGPQTQAVFLQLANS